MNCKHIKELVLSDYSDGQMLPRQARAVENHLMHCLSCRLLAQKVREDNGPLKHARLPGPDEFVWLRIKASLQQETVVENSGISMADIVRNFLYPFKPVAVMACLFVMLGVGVVIGRGFSQQQPYLTYMMGVDNQSGDEVSTGVEQYFL